MINGHGGNVYQLAETLGCNAADIIDMSSNVNPLGPMPELMAHLSTHLDTVARLPQADAHAIRKGFARKYDIDPYSVLAGNGSTQWIYCLPLALKARKALILGPTYADYADACALHNIPVQYLLSTKKNNFDFDLLKLFKKTPAADLVFICNPNNPTGRLIPARMIEELCQSRPDTVFVIDESYLPFTAESESHSLIRRSLLNAVIINSMSKIFCLPGLRIGFIKSSNKLIQQLSPFHPPWSVNGPASEAVLWLMRHKKRVDDFIIQSKRFIQKERDLFYDRLAIVPEVKFFTSTAPFILIQLPTYLRAEEVVNTMAKERLLIRDCSNFHGLSQRFIRISLKDSKNNQKAAEILIETCRKQYNL